MTSTDLSSAVTAAFFCLLSDASDAGIFLLANGKKDDFRAKVGE